MEPRVLTAADQENIAALFASVFTREPWNDDWSDEEQLRQYILDLTGSRNSLTLGYFNGGNMAARRRLARYPYENSLTISCPSNDPPGHFF